MRCRARPVWWARIKWRNDPTDPHPGPLPGGKGEKRSALLLADVEHEGVLLDLIPVRRSDLPLQFLDLRTLELDHLAGIDIDHVIVMLPAVQLVHRVTT